MTDLDPRLAALVRRLRVLPEPGPDARARLDRALAAARADGPRTERPWPRPLVLTPAAAASLAAALVLATSAVWLLAGVGRGAAASGATASERVPVQFVLIASDARSVSLVGDFNDWDAGATPLARTPGGVWSTVVPLARGRFTYSFVVDGSEWRADPEAPVASTDFGRPSSIVYVAATEVDP